MSGKDHKERKEWTAAEDAAVVAWVQASSTSLSPDNDSLKFKEAARVLQRDVAGFTRGTKQIRERWVNVLDPRVVRDPFSEEETAMLKSLVDKHGRAWKLVSRTFQNAGYWRSEGQCKNTYYSILRRLKRNQDAASRAAQEAGGGGGAAPAANGSRSAATSKGCGSQTAEVAAAAAAFELPTFQLQQARSNSCAVAVHLDAGSMQRPREVAHPAQVARDVVEGQLQAPAPRAAPSSPYLASATSSHQPGFHQAVATHGVSAYEAYGVGFSPVARTRALDEQAWSRQAVAAPASASMSASLSSAGRVSTQPVAATHPPASRYSVGTSYAVEQHHQVLSGALGVGRGLRPVAPAPGKVITPGMVTVASADSATMEQAQPLPQPVGVQGRMLHGSVNALGSPVTSVVPGGSEESVSAPSTSSKDPSPHHYLDGVISLLTSMRAADLNDPKILQPFNNARMLQLQHAGTELMQFGAGDGALESLGDGGAGGGGGSAPTSAASRKRRLNASQNDAGFPRHGVLTTAAAITSDQQTKERTSLLMGQVSTLLDGGASRGGLAASDGGAARRPHKLGGGGTAQAARVRAGEGSGMGWSSHPFSPGSFHDTFAGPHKDSGDLDDDLPLRQEGLFRQAPTDQWEANKGSGAPLSRKQSHDKFSFILDSEGPSPALGMKSRAGGIFAEAESSMELDGSSLYGSKISREDKNSRGNRLMRISNGSAL